MRRASWLFLPIALVSLGFPSRAPAQSPGDLAKFSIRESALWESVKTKDLDAMRKVFDKGYAAVYDSGILGLGEELDGVSKMTIRSYQLFDLAVRRVDSQNMLVTYKATLDADMGTQPLSGTYNNLTLWHRSGNQWYVAAHSEVKAAP
jgi:hypothetical protein